LKTSQENGLPEIAVSKAQGKLLHLLIKSIGAKRVLEVGTLGGYSTIWMAKALPDDGKLVTLEVSPLHAKVAEHNIRNAGLANKVEIQLGPALESIKALEPTLPFDFVFIDADKPNNLAYFLEAKRLTRQGAVIIVDNVVKFEKHEGVTMLLEHLKTDEEVSCTTIGMVGEKGYDGFLYAVKL